MRAIVLFAALIALPDRPNPHAKEAPKSLGEQILGDWQLLNVSTNGGIDLPLKDAELRTIRFLPKEIQVVVNGVLQPEDGAAYTLDVSRKPAAIEIHPRRGSDQINRGILNLEGDQLTLSFTVGGNQPATMYVMHLKRLKR
jgi:uncharacterized protein (TIGR03067 family)